MMAANGSAAGGFLEGLVGGALTGSDFRRQRTYDRTTADDRLRRIQMEDEALRTGRADRQRGTALSDLTLRTQHGLAYDPSAPSADGLPAGFRRVGPSAGETEAARLDALRRGVGEFLAAPEDQRPGMLTDPNIIGGLGEYDLLDDLMAQRGVAEGPDLQRFEFGGQVYGYDPKTNTATPTRGTMGAPMIAPPEAPVPLDSSKLRGEYTSQDVVAKSFEIGQAFRSIQAIGTAGSSGANDLALIFSFMKTVDPGSTVREGEFANAENAQGVAERFRSMYNKLLEGERLGPQTRAEFIDSARTMVRGQMESLKPVMEYYQSLAERQGLDPYEVVFDPLGDILQAQQQPALQPDNPYVQPLRGQGPLRAPGGR